MTPIALYYPHIHLRDDSWLKYAALYWPGMARVRPPGYPTDDSRTVAALAESRWLFDLAPPGWATAEVGEPFLRLLDEHAAVLRDCYGLAAVHGADSRRFTRLGWSNIATGDERELDPALSYLHADNLDLSVVDALEAAGLAVCRSGRGGLWLGMHPELAAVYACALAERIATEDHLHPVTDLELPHTALSGWTLDRLAETLLAEPLAAPGRDVEGAFVLLSFETVVPANLDRVPVEKIIDVRSRFGAELDAYRGYVEEQVQRLAALRKVRDLRVFEEYLRTEVQREVTARLAELREGLRGVGLDAARAVANIKSVALPSLAAAAANTVGLSPAVTGSAALAACVVGAPVQWRHRRVTAIRDSPVGYLFRLEESLDPATMLGRLRRGRPSARRGQ